MRRFNSNRHRRPLMRSAAITRRVKTEWENFPRRGNISWQNEAGLQIAGETRPAFRAGDCKISAPASFFCAL